MEPREIVEGLDKRYALFGFLFAMNNKLQAAGDRFYEEITCRQFFLLTCMHLFPGKEPSLQELAKVMGCSHQNVRTVAAKLSEKGFLELYTDSGDKRKHRLSLTPKAEEFEKKYESKAACFMNRLFAGVGEQELQAAFAVLTRMEENLDEINCDL